MSESVTWREMMASIIKDVQNNGRYESFVKDYAKASYQTVDEVKKEFEGYLNG